MSRAEDVVNKIISDLRSRNCLRQAWDEIEPDIREVIRQSWISIATEKAKHIPAQPTTVDPAVPVRFVDQSIVHGIFPPTERFF